MSDVPPILSAQERRELLAGLERGDALPTRWFRDPAIFDAELERIHRRAWHFATHTGDLAKPGDVFVRDVAGVPILLTRGEDGEIRGFLNICRHRGYPVVTEAGNRKTLQCHYHAWTYALDGSLRRAPRSESDPDFEPACFGLVPVQTHVWGPMVWVNVSREAPGFEKWTAGLPELLAERGLRVDEHAHAFDHTWEIDANWKVFQDNTIECYHCPTTHPELAKVLEMHPDKQELGVGGRYWIHHKIPFRAGVGQGLNFKRPDQGEFNYYYQWIFPTTYLQHSGRGFDIGSVDVVAVDKIRFRHVCFLPPDTPQKYRDKGFATLADDPTIWQDVDICNRVQRSHRSGLAPSGHMFPGPERLLKHFHRLIAELVLDEGAA